MRPWLLLPLIALDVSAQDLPVGTRETTFYDAGRDRNVSTVIHYPAVASGIGTDAAEGPFPVLVFGHGFLMVVSAYENFRDHFVPKGYILVLPTTEGGIPSHGEFGADLAFLAEAMQLENTDPMSPFFERVMPSTALMGHSMGGGASVLGAAGNSGIQTLVNFAAAETSPSAISAAEQVEMPTLIFAASEDCVTPIDEHQGPIYEAVTAPCKAFVNILGGGHCYFANNNFFCATGEGTCFPSLSITREQQQAVVNDLAGLWLDHFLKGDGISYASFLDSLSLSTRISGSTTCLSSAVPEAPVSGIMIMPVPAQDVLMVSGMSGTRSLSIVDLSGRLVRAMAVAAERCTLEIGYLAPGIYQLVLEGAERTEVRPFVVSR